MHLGFFLQPLQTYGEASCSGHFSSSKESQKLIHCPHSLQFFSCLKQVGLLQFSLILHWYLLTQAFRACMDEKSLKSRYSLFDRISLEMVALSRFNSRAMAAMLFPSFKSLCIAILSFKSKCLAIVNTSFLSHRQNIRIIGVYITFFGKANCNYGFRTGLEYVTATRKW